MTAHRRRGRTSPPLAERHRRELHVHCYRMLASFDEAEDAVQETFLRAWRHRDSFDGDGAVRAWLYRIATNVCLDMLRRRARQARRVASHTPRCRGCSPTPTCCSTRWRRPTDGPEAAAVDRETIELAFLAALQVLPPRQRAALIVRDVLGWPAGETAALLETQRGGGQQRPAAGPGDDAASTCPRGGPSGRPAAERRGAGAARSLHRRPRAVRRRRRHRHRRRGHPHHHAAVPDGCTRGSTSWRRCWSGPSARIATATGGCCPRWPTGCRPPPATCAAPATPCSARSSSTSCGSEGGAIAEITTFGPELFDHFGLPASV